MKDIRAKLIPQLSDYDNIGLKWHPSIMFFHRENYRSRAVNTDSFGFRITESKSDKFSPASYFLSNKKEKVSLVIGGSTAFGVGASSDKYNLASLLTNKSKIKYLNFGGRAFNSDQELSLFKNFIENLPNIEEVIILSGTNDLYLSSIENKSFMPSFFYGDIYSNALDFYTLNLQRKILKIILGGFGIEDDVWKYMNAKNIFLHLVKNLFFLNRKKIPVKHKNEYLVSFTETFKRTKSSLVFWSSLSKVLRFKVTFVLQPLPVWCEKKLTKEEIKIFEYYDNKNSFAAKVLEKMNNKEKYLSFTNNLESICNKFAINYLDSNKFFKNSSCSDEWLFVDRVHLNDRGYEELAKFIKMTK